MFPEEAISGRAGRSPSGPPSLQRANDSEGTRCRPPVRFIGGQTCSGCPGSPSCRSRRRDQPERDTGSGTRRHVGSNGVVQHLGHPPCVTRMIATRNG
jgi:hypothetical protein